MWCKKGALFLYILATKEITHTYLRCVAQIRQPDLLLLVITYCKVCNSNQLYMHCVSITVGFITILHFPCTDSKKILT